MAIIPDQLFGDAVSQSPQLRAYPREDGIIRGTLAQFGADAELGHLTPLFFDDANDEYDVWAGQSNEVNTLTAHATTPATAGDFTLTVNGQTTTAIGFDADAAEIQAALVALSNVAPGDVVAVDSGPGSNLATASHVVTLTWGGALAGTDITITADFTGISAGSDPVLATSTAGGADLSDGSDIDAFLWSPDAPLAVSTAGQLIVNVFVRGLIHRDDIPVPSGEGQADLDQALLGSSLREKGIDVQGLPNFH
jgi:hypothetical protein